MVGLGKGGLGKARLDYGSLIWSILNIIAKHDLNKISTIKVFLHHKTNLRRFYFTLLVISFSTVWCKKIFPFFYDFASLDFFEAVTNFEYINVKKG